MLQPGQELPPLQLYKREHSMGVSLLSGKNRVVKSDTVTTVTAGTLLTAEESSKLFNMSFAADVTGTITFVVEVTYDGTSFHDVAASGSVSVDGAITSPIAGIRVNVSAVTGGTVVLTTIQD